MMEIINTVIKAIKVLTAIAVGMVIIGLFISSNIRDNLLALVTMLVNSGVIGLLAALTIIYSLRSSPKILIQLFKARGLNKKFWDSIQ
jgi:hypothetical protein